MIQQSDCTVEQYRYNSWEPFNGQAWHRSITVSQVPCKALIPQTCRIPLERPNHANLQPGCKFMLVKVGPNGLALLFLLI